MSKVKAKEKEKVVLLDHFGRNNKNNLARSLVWLLFILFVLSSCTQQPTSDNSIQPIQMKGMELYYGVVPAEILIDHSGAHQEQLMHKGVPMETGTHHLVIAIFDTKTRTRITDATITGSVSLHGQPNVWKPLKIMTVGDVVSYGNYFNMPNPGPYEMVVRVRRSGSSEPAEARFQYRHPK